MDNVKKFSCGNCDDAFEAYPPDDVYIKARVKECNVCKYLKLTQIKRIVECKNCNHSNILYWHFSALHTVGEHNEAEKRRDASLNEKLNSPLDNINVNKD